MLDHWMDLLYCSEFRVSKHLIICKLMRHPVNFETELYTQLRRVFGPKRDEVTGEWRKLYNEELSDLYSLRNIVRLVKSRRMRWEGHVARMGEGRGVHRVLVGET